MKAHTAEIVSMDSNGLQVVEHISVENLEDLMRNIYKSSVIGYAGYRTVSGLELKEEIQGMPKFSEMSGPMYGGDGVVRYESKKAHEFLSA